jgi:hypothetical protein
MRVTSIQGVNVEQVITGFSGFADTIVAVVDVEQVAKDTPSQG